MDPFLTAAVAALATGAVEAAKDTAGQVIKDAYAAVRRFIIDRYKTVQLKDLEEDPESQGQRLVVAEKLAKADAAKDTDLPELIRQLTEALQASETAKGAGVNLEAIRAAVDVQIKRVGSSGSVKIKDISAGTGSVVIEDVGYTPKN